PHQIGPSYFSSAIEVMHLIREAVCRHPDGKIMVTGLEPGLEDFVLTPGKYYWEAVGFPQDTEQVFDKLKWDSDKCINWLRENNIKIISVNVAYGASICFLREKENSERFWKLIDGNPQVFKRIGSPKGRFKYRTVYEIL
ncbi:MAG TPA: hypothetical protein VMW42_13950, partial [Desulfatiglandales bacterium]|nr:hypothetical protein [Desulfatiglandales bacterium]